MEPNKQLDMPEEVQETYTPVQQAVLRILQWGAWTLAVAAMLYVMHS